MAAGCREAFICFDPDEAGEKAAKRIHRELAAIDIEAYPVHLPPGYDLADYFSLPLTDEGRTGRLAHLLADAEAAATGKVAV